MDANQEAAMQCGVSAMPTFQMFRFGAKVAEFTGADENRLRAILAEHGGPPTNMPPGTPARDAGSNLPARGAGGAPLTAATT